MIRCNGEDIDFGGPCEESSPENLSPLSETLLAKLSGWKRFESDGELQWFCPRCSQEKEGK